MRSGSKNNENKQSSVLSGNASCPDTAKHFSTTQAAWEKESEAVIQNFASEIDKFETFFDAYQYLATKRQGIAIKLNHTCQFGSRSYGSWRRDDSSTTIEYIYEKFCPKEEGEIQPWEGQKEEAFKLTRALILQTKDKVYPSSYRDCGDYKYKQTVEDGVITHQLKILSPIKKQQINGKNHSQTLSTIFLAEHTDKELDSIIIEYAPFNNYDIQGDFELANDYYQSLRKCSSFDDNALLIAGRLKHLMTHVLPVQRGNAAIMEWFVRGAALAQGVKLGPFDHTTGLSWDFKALLTPNREEYSRWYARSAYSNSLSPSQQQQPVVKEQKAEVTPVSPLRQHSLMQQPVVSEQTAKATPSNILCDMCRIL